MRPASTIRPLELLRGEADLELLAGPAADHGRDALPDLAEPVAHPLELEEDLLRVDPVDHPAADGAR